MTVYPIHHHTEWQALEAIQSCTTLEMTTWALCCTRKPALVRLARFLQCHKGHSGDSHGDLAQHVAASYRAKLTVGSVR